MAGIFEISFFLATCVSISIGLVAHIFTNSPYTTIKTQRGQPVLYNMALDDAQRTPTAVRMSALTFYPKRAETVRTRSANMYLSCVIRNWETEKQPSQSNKICTYEIHARKKLQLQAYWILGTKTAQRENIHYTCGRMQWRQQYIGTTCDGHIYQKRAETERKSNRK